MLFNDQVQIDVISYVLENTNSVRFFPFADKYVVAEAVPEEWNEKLLQIAKVLEVDVRDLIRDVDTK